VKVAEIFAALGFEVNETGAKEFEKKLDDVAKSAFKMSLAVAGAIFSIDRFSETATRASVAIGNFALQTGLSAEKLQKWQYAANMSNMAMDADNVTGSIKGLQQALLEVRMGGGNPEAFRWLRVDPRAKDAYTVLEQLRKSVKTLDPAFASMYLKQIGLNEQWLNVLTKTDEEFNQLMNTAPVRSSAYIKSMEAIGRMSREFRMQFRLLMESVVVKGLPQLKKFYEALGSGLGMLTNITEGAIKVADKLMNIWKGMPEWVRAVASVIGVLRFPLAALLLILDDVAMYVNGGDSVIGRLIDKISNIPLVRRMMDMGDLFDKSQNEERFSNLRNMITGKKESPKPEQYTSDTLPPLPMNGDDAAARIEKEVLKTVVPPVNWMPSDGSKESDIRSLFDDPSYAVIPKPDTLRSHASNVTQTNTINVHGSGDPQATADAVTNSLQRQMNRATAGMNNTVNY